ncbi:MAG: ribonuclease P protein component [Pseudomonadota bacterium]|nr:ribonuclease P protein component [Pseudomonadota bacterium]
MGQLPRDRRVTSRREIAGLLTGARVRAGELELYWRPAAEPRSRATCITPKFGHTAVERNRLRRRLKELMREILLTRPEGRDYLVRARPPAYGLDFRELAATLRSLVSRMEGMEAGRAATGQP